MSVPNTSELEDDQIEALIRKLSAIKGSAPELIAALEAEANSRLATKGRSGRGGSDRGRERGVGNKQRSSRSHSYEDEVVEDEYEDEEFEDEEEETDSEEEDDEFDDDGPCVGYGYSDEVSVISEMTTPTVVSGIHVSDEERYAEIGKKSNKPDLLSQVNRVNAAKNKAKISAAGLNSEKRRTYTSGLTKISETAESAAVTKPPKTAAPQQRAATKKAPARKGDAPAPPRKTPSRDRGIRRDTSPSRGGGTSKKKSSSSAKKSNHNSSSGNKASSRKDNGHADAFGDDWHKSLTTGDFNSGSGMDDNGFPFSFGDTDNAFQASSNSFFNSNKKPSKGGGGGGDTTDPFDPFSNGDPFAKSDAFDRSNNAFAAPSAKPKAKSTGSRPRRTSGIATSSSRSKQRDQSPRRKGTR